jgi:hypothetical protein
MSKRQQSRPWVSGFAVKDCALVAIATGRSARTLKELRDELLTIDPASIYFHFWGGLLRSTFDDTRYYNGFATWIGHVLRNQKLAERLSVIDPAALDDMEAVRSSLIGVIDDGFEEASDTRVSEDEAFHFIRSQIVVFSTRKILDNPPELPAAISAMPRSGVFYHFIDARRRTPHSVDDFTTWLTDIDRDGYHDLCVRIANIDPFYATLEETRSELERAFAEFL